MITTEVPTTHPVTDRYGDVWEHLDGEWVFTSPDGYQMTWPALHHDDCLGPYTPVTTVTDADTQAIARGYTHKVTKRYIHLPFPPEVAYFYSESIAKVYQEQHPGGVLESLT